MAVWQFGRLTVLKVLKNLRTQALRHLGTQALFLILIMFLIISCSPKISEQVTVQKKTPRTNCINRSNQDVIIRWGTRVKSLDYHYGYYLNTSGEVFKYHSKDNKDLRINNISKELLCRILKKTQVEFVRVGALNVPADTTAFVFYERPGRNTLRAMWNPKTPAIGSDGMRNVRDLLYTCYPDNRILLHEEDR